MHRPEEEAAGCVLACVCACLRTWTHEQLPGESVPRGRTNLPSELRRQALPSPWDRVSPLNALWSVSQG